MAMRGALLSGLAAALLASGLVSGCCKKKPPPPEALPPEKPFDPPAIETAPIEPGKTVRFSKVPLMVDMPPGWKQSQNTAQWLVYRPSGGGALVAMSGEKSCTLVEKRLYSALIELGLSNVVWDGKAKKTRLGGLRATVAEGTALESNQISFVKYSLVHAKGGRGCLVTLYNVWKSKAGDYRQQADTIIMSVRPKV